MYLFNVHETQVCATITFRETAGVMSLVCRLCGDVTVSKHS